MKLPDSIVRELKKKQYGLYGHSAVQICSWTKKVLQGKCACYKQYFYGVHTHKCMQFSPAALWCSNECIYCWRPVELMSPEAFGKSDSPEKIVAGLVMERKKLLSGFGGRNGINLELWKDSLLPDHFAISLSGEPCIYPWLPELIAYLRNGYKARSIFLVTNGTFPGMLMRLIKANALPHQLYVSAVAANKGLYTKIVRPKQRDAWERFNTSLRLLRKICTRTVLRFTLIKGVNDSRVKETASLLHKANPDFIEIKAYMFLGYSRQRLKMENMPVHSYVRGYSERICALLPGYDIASEHSPSRIVLLKNKRIKEKSLFPLEESNDGPNQCKEATG